MLSLKKKSRLIVSIFFISPLLISLLFISSLLVSTTASASHSFGGLDMCALYPEVMPPGLPTEQLPNNNSHATQLMQTYCTQCHELPGPGRHTADEWPAVLQNMLLLMDVATRFSGLMGNIKNPSHEESKQLQQYLTRYALKPMEQKPAGVGARAFENHCGECHALPDPTQYNKDHWPELLKRMQRNMTIMKYAPPSSEVMLQIQHYLQSGHSPESNSNNPLSLTTTDSFHEAAQQESVRNQKNKSSSIHLQSLLALGPFLLLVIIGLVRWRLNSRKDHNIQVPL